jgi:hypothetical protein
LVHIISAAESCDAKPWHGKQTHKTLHAAAQRKMPALLLDFSAGVRALDRLSKPRVVDGKTVKGSTFLDRWTSH